MSSRTTRRSYQKGGGQKPAQAKSAQPKMAEPKIDMTNAQLLAAQEVKREARKQRQMAAQAAAQRRRSVARIQRIGILAAVLLVLVGGALAFFLNESSKPGQGVPQQPSPHIPNVTDPHAAYDSDPPTSGPHVPQTAPWGVSATPVPKENMVHNLEDGGVVISYRPDLDKATVDRLAELTRNYSTDVLMAPYPGLSTAIALTAWGRIDRLDTFDEARIKRFVDAFKGKDHHRDSGS